MVNPDRCDPNRPDEAEPPEPGDFSSAGAVRYHEWARSQRIARDKAAAEISGVTDYMRGANPNPSHNPAQEPDADEANRAVHGHIYITYTRIPLTLLEPDDGGTLEFGGETWMDALDCAYDWLKKNRDHRYAYHVYC